MDDPHLRAKRRPIPLLERLQILVASLIYNLLRLTGYCVLWCGAIVVAYQGYLWFHDGVWSKLELRSGLRALAVSEPTLDWAESQSVLAFGLDTPISATLVVLGLLVVAFAVAYLEPLTSDPRR